MSGQQLKTILDYFHHFGACMVERFITHLQRRIVVRNFTIFMDFGLNIFGRRLKNEHIYRLTFFSLKANMQLFAIGSVVQYLLLFLLVVS